MGYFHLALVQRIQMRLRVHDMILGFPEIFLALQGRVSMALLSQQLVCTRSAGSGNPRTKGGKYLNFVF